VTLSETETSKVFSCSVDLQEVSKLSEVQDGKPSWKASGFSHELEKEAFKEGFS
jgi:hypothetical protein